MCVRVCVRLCTRASVGAPLCVSVCVSADLSQPQRGRLDPAAGGGGEPRVPLKSCCRRARGLPRLLRGRTGARAGGRRGPGPGDCRGPTDIGPGAQPQSHCPVGSALGHRAALLPRPPRPQSLLRFSASRRPPSRSRSRGSSSRNRSVSTSGPLSLRFRVFLNRENPFPQMGGSLASLRPGAVGPAAPSPPPARPSRPGIDPAACTHRISPNGFADDSTFSLKAAPRSSPLPCLRLCRPRAPRRRARPELSWPVETRFLQPGSSAQGA